MKDGKLTVGLDPQQKRQVGLRFMALTNTPLNQDEYQYLVQALDALSAPYAQYSRQGVALIREALGLGRLFRDGEVMELHWGEALADILEIQDDVLSQAQLQCFLRKGPNGKAKSKYGTKLFQFDEEGTAKRFKVERAAV